MSKSILKSEPRIRNIDHNDDVGLFVHHHLMSDNMIKFAQSLFNISPTSTSVERTFSTCSDIMTAIRTRMSEDLFDRIVILKKMYK